MSLLGLLRDDSASLGDMVAKRDLLTTIPRIAAVTAERIIAEIGTDMSVFPTQPSRRRRQGRRDELHL